MPIRPRVMSVFTSHYTAIRCYHQEISSDREIIRLYNNLHASIRVTIRSHTQQKGAEPLPTPRHFTKELRSLRSAIRNYPFEWPIA